MNRLAIFAATLLLTSCHSAPTKARAIMAPVAKRAAHAGKLAEKQSGSIGRLRGSVKEAVTVAEKLNTERPDGDTARLLLSLRIATSEADMLHGTNDELRLTIAGMEVAVAQAQDKVAVEIAGAETWKSWAWFWGKAFFGLLAAWIALRMFKTYLMTVPVIGPIISRIL